eukprot:scaffold7544_cov107-Isochrysis_galbana.AAC.14
MAAAWPTKLATGLATDGLHKWISRSQREHVATNAWAAHQTNELIGWPAGLRSTLRGRMVLSPRSLSLSVPSAEQLSIPFNSETQPSLSTQPSCTRSVSRSVSSPTRSAVHSTKWIWPCWSPINKHCGMGSPNESVSSNLPRECGTDSSRQVPPGWIRMLVTSMRSSLAWVEARTSRLCSAE